MSTSTLNRPSQEDMPEHFSNPPQPPVPQKNGDARWVRPAFISLLLATAVFWFWNLTKNGYGNEFYAAAVQAGTKSWKAFLFGSADWSNAITVDKTPGSLWPMEISGRIFGFNSWSMLAPNVLEGVGAVGLLYASLKRWFGPAAGLLAGAVLALTPVAALMFRFNNPDASLTFLLVASAYTMTRAIETPKPGGKVAARRSRPRRSEIESTQRLESSHFVSAANKVLKRDLSASPLTWILLTGVCLGFAFLAKELQALLVVPGLGLAYLVAAPISLKKRIVHLLAGLGAMIASAGWWVALVSLWSTDSRPFFGGSTNNTILEVILGGNGLSRLTGESSGGGIGGGFPGGGANFSGASGWGRLFNNVMGGEISWLLPAAIIAFAVGLIITLHTLRTNRARAAIIIWGGWFAVTTLTLSFMNGIVHTYYTVALAPAIAALIGIVVPRLWSLRQSILSKLTLAVMIVSTGVWSYVLLDRTPDWHPWIRTVVLAFTVVAVVGLLLESFVQNHIRRTGIAIATIALAACLLGPAAYAVDTVNTSHTGSIPTSGPSTGSGFGGPFGGGGFAGGGFGGNETTSVSSDLVSLLQTDASKYTWPAAAVSSQSSAGLQIAADVPVMSIGGFSGSDPSPTLAQFKQYVADGKIHYFVSGGGGMGGMGGNSGIASWVSANFTGTTVGNYTVYDLTSPSAA